MSEITIARPDKQGVMQLSQEEAARTLQACQLYISDIEKYYPAVHADVLQIFSDCGKADPEFKKMEDLFTVAMCRDGYSATVE